jgi:hypothetical protein
MFRSSALLALFAFTAFSAVACSNASEDPGSNPESADSNVTAADHPTAVKACDRTHDAASQSAGSTHAMIQAEGNWNECLHRANDGAVGKLEANLTEINSYLKGTAASSIAKAREQGESLCAELDKASPDFGGSLSSVEAAGCRANRERAIAAFMDAYAYFGVEQQTIPEKRDQHPACYTAYDAASQTANATNEMAQVAADLGECIGKNAAGLAAPLATIEVENDAAAGPLDVATARVKKITADAIDSGRSLCAVFNQAGSDGGGSLSRVTTADCWAHFVESVHAELKATVGE